MATFDRLRRKPAIAQEVARVWFHNPSVGFDDALGFWWGHSLIWMRRWVLDPCSGESIAQVSVTKSTMHWKANARLVESALGKLRAPLLLVVASLEALRATDVWRRHLRTDFAD